jgi:uncharacterized membrane protein
LYQFLVFVHVFSAVVWVGGALFSEAIVSAAHRRGDTEYARVYSLIAETGARVYPVATIALIATAVAMVAQRWSFGTLWIDIALGLFVVTFGLGVGYFSPRGKSISRAVDSGEDGPELVAQIRKIHRIQRLDLLVLVAAVVLMVFKPI